MSLSPDPTAVVPGITDVPGPPSPAPTPTLAVVRDPRPAPGHVALCLRLTYALDVLGILDITGNRWAAPSLNGIGFGELDYRSADRFVGALEGVADDLQEAKLLAKDAADWARLRLGDDTDDGSFEQLTLF